MAEPLNSVQQFRLAIDLCRKNELMMPAIAIIFSSIDTMAWLACPPAQADVEKGDFLSWVDRYLLPGSGLTCTALELYSARCGVVHTMTAESRIVRAGGARKVLYGWGNHDASLLGELGGRIGVPCVGLDIDVLIGAFGKALERFGDEQERDDDLRNRVEARLPRIFADWRLDDPEDIYRQVMQE